MAPNGALKGDFGGDLAINSNASLTSLSGLDALRSVGGDVDVDSNATLCEDEVSDLVGQLTAFTGDVVTSGNTGECPI